jgi:hypothetical protein
MIWKIISKGNPFSFLNFKRSTEDIRFEVNKNKNQQEFKYSINLLLGLIFNRVYLGGHSVILKSTSVAL